jgi:hypothetical protein
MDAPSFRRPNAGRERMERIGLMGPTGQPHLVAQVTQVCVQSPFKSQPSDPTTADRPRRLWEALRPPFTHHPFPTRDSLPLPAIGYSRRVSQILLPPDPDLDTVRPQLWKNLRD